MNPFEKVSIGNTGVEVTRLGLGGAPLAGMAEFYMYGDGYENYLNRSFAEALEIIQSAYKKGIRYFHTEPLYGTGRSEVRYGRILSQLPRDSFSISTKASRLLVPKDPDFLDPYSEDGLPNYKVEFDFSADGLQRSLEASMKRLHLDSTDILFLHDSDFFPEDAERNSIEGLTALLKLRDSGVVKAIGMGVNHWETPASMIKQFDLDIILLAGRYTLLDQTSLTEFMPLCLEQGVKIVVGGPYNSGILARDLNKPVTFHYELAPKGLIDKARRIKAVCDRHQVDLKAAALQFIIAHPAVASIIPGSASVEELDDNICMAQQEIPSDLWLDLKNEKLIPDKAPTPFID